MATRTDRHMLAGKKRVVQQMHDSAYVVHNGGKTSLPLCTLEAVFLESSPSPTHLPPDRYICFVCHLPWYLLIVNITVKELCSLHGQSLRPGQEKEFPQEHAGFFSCSGMACGLLVYDANHTGLLFPPQHPPEKEHLKRTLQIVSKLQVHQHHFRKYCINAVNI